MTFANSSPVRSVGYRRRVMAEPSAFAHFSVALSLTLGSLLALTACSGAQTPGGSASSSAVELPARAEVATRLAAHLARDPNRAVCERIAQGFSARNSETLEPLFDYPAFAARVTAHAGVAPAEARALAAAPRRPIFARYSLPTEPREWSCLDTRTYLDAPHVAVRVRWANNNVDYVLLRLGADAQRPITDYYVVSSGVLSSELQAIGFTPEFAEPMRLVGAMFQQSYDGAFADIIRVYRTLPERLRMHPVAFRHFINAVFTTERTGSPLYVEATTLASTVFRDSPYASAYWRLVDARRSHREGDERAARRTLIDLLDDDALAAD